MICFALFYLTIFIYQASGRPPGDGQSSRAPFLDQLAMIRLCRRQLSPGLPHCRQQHKRWYYDSKSQTCKAFVWSGCGGNSFDNRFLTHDECENRCQGVLPCPPPRPHKARNGCQVFTANDINDGCPHEHFDCHDIARTAPCPPAIDIGPLPQDCWITSIRSISGCPKDIVTCA